MKDIQTIPTEELEKDLEDSHKDIKDCGNALVLGVTRYSGGEVQKRLESNKHFVKVIEAEIERRKAIKC